MAKTSSVEKNKRREKLSKLHAPKRAALKAVIMDRELPVEERFALSVKLAAMPRNGAQNRLRNRCALTGRPRAYHGKFNLCRNQVRKLAAEGQLPGMVKASW